MENVNEKVEVLKMLANRLICAQTLTEKVSNSYEAETWEKEAVIEISNNLGDSIDKIAKIIGTTIVWS